MNIYLEVKMPNKARTHEENRSRCCAICFLESGEKKKLQSITSKVIELIRKHVQPDYIQDGMSPKVICDTCRFDLYRNENDVDKKYPLNISEHFGVKVPRQTSGTCDCVICRRARFNGPQWFMFCKAQEGKLSPPPRDPATEAEKLCKTCLTPVKLLLSESTIWSC